MFSNIDDYVTDPSLEKEGIDLSFGKGRFITVRRTGGANKAYTNYVANCFKEQETLVGKQALDEETAKQTMYDAVAKHIVIDWRGWKDNDGNDIHCTYDNVIALFNASREIYEHVMTNCANLDNFRTHEVAEVGNE